MKWQMLLTVAIAAVTGAIAGNAASRYFAGGSSADQTRIVAAVRRDSRSVVALDAAANATQIVQTNPLGALSGGAEKIVPFKESDFGSGFVYDRSGLILTADHVIHGASRITVSFDDGVKVPAHIFAEDVRDDVALVKVNYPQLPPPLTLGNSRDIEKGDWVIAIGEPLALRQTVTVGVVSGFNRNETMAGNDGVARTFRNLLQTSAPINPGSSGGPLLDLNGDVIAISQSMALPAQGIGFAVPSDTVAMGIASMLQHPGISPPQVGYLGVALMTVTGRVRYALHYDGSGAAVTRVIAASPAATAGLHAGDVIEAIDGRSVANAAQAIETIALRGPGTTVRLRIWESGESESVAARLTVRPVR